tara:strand:- start:44 stop:1693 length:1650 start_codon:yes stop_codon:yes gene_type:complete
MKKNNLTTKETFTLALQHHKKNNFQAAEQLYKQILEIEPDHIESIFYLGSLSIQIRNFDRAKQLFNKTIQIDPNHAQAYNNLGAIAFQKLKKNQEAISYYEKAIQINPNFAQAYNNLGVVFQELKKNQEAVSCYEKAIQIDPNYAEAHNSLGITFQQLKKNQEAVSCYEKSIQINPNFAQAHNNLGIVFKELGEFQKAISCHEKAIQIDPNNPDACCNLAFLYKNIDNYEKALQYCDQALNLVSHMPKAASLKSDILSKNAPAWHAPMINDNDRNNFYYSALKSVIKTSSSVFEIGTGSGLLSIMAANLGAHEINTCETNSIMANTAMKVIADNNLSEKINVIPKKSNDIKVGEDINKPANILVSEIFSSSLLSEGVIPSLEDAKQRLISKNAKIIPEYGSIMISLFGGDDIGKNIYTEKFENIKLKKFNSIVPKKHVLHRQDLEIDLMTNALEAFRFDFVNKNNFPSESKKIEIEAIKKGRSYGIIQWIKLEMDNGLKYENHPANFTSASGWQKILYVFDDPIELSIGQKMVITAKHERNNVWFFLEK